MATKETIADLLDRYEPSIKAAFLDAIQDIRSQAEIGRIADLLQAGDIESALQAAHLDNAAFQNLDVALANVFRAGGNFAMASLPQRGLVFRFDARNIRAEEILRAMSVGLVTRIVEDQKQALRTALVDGMERGANPRTVALDIVGRVNRQSGKREGGIVGLTAQQERFVAKARQELLSGDPAELERYLGRTRRDKRFDRVVTRAIREGNPVDRPTIEKMLGRYKDSLLLLRGETIARTEALSSLHQAQNEAFRQAVDTGNIAQQDIRRIWRTARDERVRHSHRMLEGESVGLEERFSNGLMFPGDPDGPASETIMCRCYIEARIDFLSNIR